MLLDPKTSPPCPSRMHVLPQARRRRGQPLREWRRPLPFCDAGPPEGGAPGRGGFHLDRGEGLGPDSPRAARSSRASPWMASSAPVTSIATAQCSSRRCRLRRGTFDPAALSGPTRATASQGMSWSDPKGISSPCLSRPRIKNLILVDARNRHLVGRRLGRTDHIHGLAMSSDGRSVRGRRVRRTRPRVGRGRAESGGRHRCRRETHAGFALSPDGGLSGPRRPTPRRFARGPCAGRRHAFQRLPEIAGATERASPATRSTSTSATARGP